jgi:hypothetical protein
MALVFLPGARGSASFWQPVAERLADTAGRRNARFRPVAQMSQGSYHLSVAGLIGTPRARGTDPCGGLPFYARPGAFAEVGLAYRGSTQHHDETGSALVGVAGMSAVFLRIAGYIPFLEPKRSHGWQWSILGGFDLPVLLVEGKTTERP